MKYYLLWTSILTAINAMIIDEDDMKVNIPDNDDDDDDNNDDETDMKVNIPDNVDDDDNNDDEDDMKAKSPDNLLGEGGGDEAVAGVGSQPVFCLFFALHLFFCSPPVFFSFFCFYTCFV